MHAVAASCFRTIRLFTSEARGKILRTIIICKLSENAAIQIAVATSNLKVRVQCFARPQLIMGKTTHTKQIYMKELFTIYACTHLPEVVLIEAEEMILQNFDLFEHSGVHESASIHPQLNLPHR